MCCIDSNKYILTDGLCNHKGILFNTCAVSIRELVNVLQSQGNQFSSADVLRQYERLLIHMCYINTRELILSEDVLYKLFVTQNVSSGYAKCPLHGKDN